VACGGLSPGFNHSFGVVVEFVVDRYSNLDMEDQRDEQRVHLIVYHLIWCPKRRKSVLVGPVVARCRELIGGKSAGPGWTILALAIQPDHIHLFVRVWPSSSAAEVVKECKGITSFHLRKEFPHLLKLPSMWTRSYFASTAGNVSQETIQRYIAAQTGR
jgi:putative transposase